MKSFKQLLKEMPVDNDYGMGMRFPLHRYSQYMDYHDEKDLMKHHGTYNVNKDYEIHHHSVSHGLKYGDKHYYNVVHKPTGYIHLHLTTIQHPGWHHKNQQVSNLAGTEENQFKAPELYHHLLKNKIIHNLFSDHTQSIGGKKTWQRLSKMPGINMRLMKRGKEVHMNKVWNKNYNDFSAVFMALYHKPKLNESKKTAALALAAVGALASTTPKAMNYTEKDRISKNIIDVRKHIAQPHELADADHKQREYLYNLHHYAKKLNKTVKELMKDASDRTKNPEKATDDGLLTKIYNKADK